VMRKRRILFVCGRNVDRSPTAEHLFDGIDGFEAKSAGVSLGATVPLTRELMERADAVYVMEYKHQKAALKIAPSCWKKIEILEIPDKYYWDQPELKQLLVEKLRTLFVPQKC
jgi:predicted protein tyrosine phosphatase